MPMIAAAAMIRVETIGRNARICVTCLWSASS